MAIRSVSDGDYSLYVSASDIDDIKQEMAVILYSVGLNGANPELYEIDDVIDAIHDHFYFDTNLSGVFNGIKHGKDVQLAHEPFMRKHSHMLKIEARRLFRWLKLANGAGANV